MSGFSAGLAGLSAAYPAYVQGQSGQYDLKNKALDMAAANALSQVLGGTSLGMPSPQPSPPGQASQPEPQAPPPPMQGGQPPPPGPPVSQAPGRMPFMGGQVPQFGGPPGQVNPGPPQQMPQMPPTQAPSPGGLPIGAMGRGPSPMGPQGFGPQAAAPQPQGQPPMSPGMGAGARPPGGAAPPGGQINLQSLVGAYQQAAQKHPELNQPGVFLKTMQQFAPLLQIGEREQVLALREREFQQREQHFQQQMQQSNQRDETTRRGQDMAHPGAVPGKRSEAPAPAQGEDPTAKRPGWMPNERAESLAGMKQLAGEYPSMDYERPKRPGQVLSNKAIDNIAERFIESGGDQKVINSAIGSGKDSLGDRRAVTEQVQEIMSEQNVSPKDITAKGAEIIGKRQEARTIGMATGRIEIASQEVAKLVPQAIEASRNYPRGAFRPLNQLIQGFSRMSSDDPYYAFAAANNGLKTAYVRAMNPFGVPRIAERAEIAADGLFDKATDQSSYEAVIKQILKEVQASQAAVHAASKGEKVDPEKIFSDAVQRLETKPKAGGKDQTRAPSGLPPGWSFKVQ